MRTAPICGTDGLTYYASESGAESIYEVAKKYKEYALKVNKNFKLTSQPSVDLVTLSPNAKIANVSKPTQDSKVAYGKLIKKVLNKYFDNDNIATDLMEDKKTNLNQLVEELGKEQYCKYKAPRKKAMNLMREDAIAKYKVMQQSIIDEENENRRFFNLYLNQFEDWCDF